MENLIQEQINNQQLYYLYRLQAVLTRLSRNISYKATGVNPRMLTSFNPNLYKLAAEYYQDATLWTIIAKANNLYEPLVDGLTTLIIPPKPSTGNGGLLMV